MTLTFEDDLEKTLEAGLRLIEAPPANALEHQLARFNLSTHVEDLRVRAALAAGEREAARILDRGGRGGL